MVEGEALGGLAAETKRKRGINIYVFFFVFSSNDALFRFMKCILVRCSKANI